MKPLILDTRSVCAALRVFPRTAPRFFSAMFRLSFVCCWATADSCGVSCGAIVGASDFSASFPVVVLDAVLLRGRATGLTITAVAHGISGRLLTLHPPNMHVAQQRRVKKCEEPRANTVKGRTGFSVMFRPRV